MNQTLLILLSGLVLGSCGKLILNKPYNARISTDLTLNEDKTSINHTNNEPTRQDDEEPIESSETVSYNKVQKSSEDEEDQSAEEEEPEGPPDHVIPYSDHEEPRNVSTKPKYVGPGEWAKPPKDKDVPLDFVPTKVYAQVRKTHTVRRLPRRKAIETAESEEEKENAARLREVVRNSKVNTVYTEEGYEDSAYDHAGHSRDADFEEAYARKLRERLNQRKKSGGEDNDEEEVTEQSNSKTRVDPEEFKDYEDYEDRRAVGNVVSGRHERKEAYPKVVAEEGIRKLQEDVEKEVEDIERGLEIGKLDENEEHSKESGEQRRKTKKRKRPVSPKKSKITGEKFEESQKIRYKEDYSTTVVPVESTSLRNELENFADPSGSFKYQTHDFQGVEEAPTTVSYSQLFWDYFKTRQIEPTTIQSSTLLESTTASPNFLQPSPILGNINTLAPYSHYGQETTTSFPVADSAIFGAKTLAPAQFLTDPTFDKNKEQNDQLFGLEGTNVAEFWQPIISNEPATTINAQFLGTYDDKILNNDQEIPLSNLVKNLDSKEESDRNLDSSLFNPSLNLLTNRRPRYKIAVRQKPKKPVEYFSQKSSTLSSINENTTPKSIPFNENYLKVLMHLKNQEKAKNLHHPNSLQPSNFYPSMNINNPKDPRRTRPSVSPKTNDHYNVPPRRSKESTVGSQKSHRPPQIRSNSSRVVQRTSSRNRNLIPSTDLVPPSPLLREDTARPKETVDYLTGNGRARNLYRPFRRTSPFEPIVGIRAKRRERRSTNDSSGGGVKGSRSAANNHASNRVEIERAAKNLSLERNSRLDANDGPQVALVPDTSAEKPTGEKKSRSFREGRVVERESREGIQDDSGSLKYNDGEWKRKDIIDEEKSRMNVESNKSHEDLLNESPRVTNDVIQKEIDARFNEKEEDEPEDTEDDVEVEVPDFDYVEELPEDDDADNQTSGPGMDLQKYPFYKDEKIPTPSALKYAIDPERLPSKTHGGMEFYGSRDAYKHCEEVEPTLKVLPENEEPVPERGPEENLPRLRGLGDKLDCFKAKYFDDDPFDNPLFQEKEVEEPRPPAKLDAKRFASRIMMFPKQSDDYVIQKSSKRPENYRRPRKPSSNAVRVQKSRRVRYRIYPGRGTRPRVYRVQGVRVKYTNGSRRPQKVVRRPVTSASDVWSLYTPYQNQVYEDVMGTIRNMANSYQVHEVTTIPTSDEITVVSDMIGDVKANVSRNSTVLGNKNKDNETTLIMERPNKMDLNIEGLMPPKCYDRRRNSYRRNRPPQKNKPRTQHTRKPTTGSRANPRQKVRVYKRDLRSKRDAEERMLPSSEENDNERIPENSSSRIGIRRNSKASDVVSKLIDAKRKSKVSKSGSESNNGDQKKEKSEKVVYTIKDRIRYSKPKGDAVRVGKFVNETEVQEDKRRKEPKYNFIKRRKPLNLTSSTTQTPPLDSTEEINWTESSVPTATLINDAEETSKEVTTEYQEDIQNQSQNATTKLERQDLIARSNEQPVNKTGNDYAVYENVNEDEETTTRQPHPETSSELFKLKTFLDTDPSEYTDVSSEEFKKSLFSNNNSSNDFKFDSESTNAKETGNKESDDEEDASFHRSNEDSSEKLETSTESSGESEDSKESDSEERGTFFKYESRPSSPAENFEDEKYSELGPRVNKPAFFHPPFSFSRTSRSRGSSEEAEESGEEKEYVFPWYRDKEIERKKRRHRNRGKSIMEYEYPWERRERLALEEKKKRKALSKTFDDDEDVEETSLNNRKLYPRGKYRFWSRIDRDASEESASDAAGSSSEHRPVGKYSSKYSAKNTKLPINRELKNTKSRSLEEISRSIKKALEGDSDEKKNDSSYKSRSTSRGIVPEDVTLEPIRRNRKKKNSTSDDTDTERRNSTELLKSGSVDSAAHTTVLKTIAEEVANSTERSNKKRRRPAKSTVSNVESTLKSVEDSNRSRRRQKSGSTTPATITSTSATSTTSASRVVRRRYQKSVKDSKRIGAVKAENRLDNDVNNRTKTSASKSRALDHRSNPTKEIKEENKNLKSKISDRLNKTENLQETSMENFNRMKHLDKSNNEQENNLENENLNRKSDGDELEKIEEIDRLNRKFASVDSDEKFGFKDDRIDMLSDFDKSDDDFGSILKTGADFTPQNRAVQLSEQESREVVSSVSWISENYNF